MGKGRKAKVGGTHKVKPSKVGKSVGNVVGPRNRKGVGKVRS